MYSLRIFPQEEGGSSYLLIIPDFNLVSLLIRQPPSCRRKPSNSRLWFAEFMRTLVIWALPSACRPDCYSYIHTNIYFPFAQAITLLKSLYVKSGLCNYFSRKLAFYLLLGLVFGKNGNHVLGLPVACQALAGPFLWPWPGTDVKPVAMSRVAHDPVTEFIVGHGSAGEGSLPDLYRLEKMA